MVYETFPGWWLLTHLKNKRGELLVFGLLLDVLHLKQKYNNNNNNNNNNNSLKNNHRSIQAICMDAIFNVHE